MESRIMTPGALVASAALVAMLGAGRQTPMATSGSAKGADIWAQRLLAFPYAAAEPGAGPMRALIRQDYERLQRNRSVIGTPLRIGTRGFAGGLGTHSHSVIRVTSPKPIVSVRGWIGVDANERTQGGSGSVEFVVKSSGRELYRSPVLRGGGEPVRLDVATASARSVELIVEDAGETPACDHADWAEVVIGMADGSEAKLADLPEGAANLSGRYPFSFSVGGRHCDDVLPGWRVTNEGKAGEPGRTLAVHQWDDPASDLRVQLESVRFGDYPAVEWVMSFENRGSADTPIIENVFPLDVTLAEATKATAMPRLHRTAGGTPTPDQFESTILDIGGRAGIDIGAGAGRSSTRDFPFFKIEMGDVSVIAAVGWSGDWSGRVEAPARESVHVTAGQSATRFVLHPGERVRTPRILLMRSPGHTLEANALFRQLIYKHYAARRSGKPILPLLFSNTCFTRGGGWLNECNAANQISLIPAYAPLGVEAVITDAGWFEGGWPDGAGNWTPRKDAYPGGMAPVAAAAAQRGMTYGLWFEPERVVAGTSLHKQHPEWCLAAGNGPQGTYLADFGLPEVRDHFFGIVKGFMDLPGFRVYRQDFNMDPAPYWRFNDAPDRGGVTGEMKYIEGLYAFWDRLAEAWPDGIREECASGGHRMDLETLKRFHIHQKTDYWFDNEVDQASIWALSQYLPNSTFVAPINRLDDYTFRSVFATS
ncbi:MAG: hypothetical protein FJX72_02785, partial [Armatimonadetes bacterium]|nr:hypothetical protein [Armatimonadota bacterium]